MSDWFDEAQESLKSEAVAATGVTADQFNAVYGFLSEIGLIDYDTEKEVLYERYVDDE